MPLISADANEIVYWCPRCDDRHTHPIASLSLGSDVSPDAIPMPPCPCGRSETLWVTHDEPDTPDEEQAVRRVLNRLGIALRVAGQTHVAHDFSAVPEPVNVGDATHDYTQAVITLPPPHIPDELRKKWDRDVQPLRDAGVVPTKVVPSVPQPRTGSPMDLFLKGKGADPRQSRPTD